MSTREYYRQYREKNRERIRAKQRAWYEHAKLDMEFMRPDLLGVLCG